MFIAICVETKSGLDSFYLAKVHIFWCVGWILGFSCINGLTCLAVGAEGLSSKPSLPSMDGQ